ncbi:putative metal-dependent hydrolase [Paenibacillus sp. GSMTC-2017]|uniref:YfiT family bacillithiol transferase n=1 Tax=Paenibacillus sp. GSMTC-2017 TaxID=2794350 RepID=UPI0018D83259|nr:putative metal-dependent hydrolase [Paenibacillus sp. GSMTC-2017]MBH5316762.1 putative metal-dependent hydrolase [Paenibacillus sp. GSMTC-2017]
MEKLRYPIGRYSYEGMTVVQKDKWIVEIENLPAQMRQAIDGLTEEQLNTPYRPEGWTVRQVVHHLADATINCFSRFKLALTEANPTVKPFDEEGWANTVDSLDASPELSLIILEGIYARWVLLLKSLQRADFDKQFYHPAIGKQVQLSYFLGFVAWHGNHHLAHITNLKDRLEW